VEAYADERGLILEGYGSWTLKNEPEERGAEADECYILAAEGEDPEAKDRPDLAIEVVWTSGGLDKLEVYKGLGVGEVWFWRKGRIAVFVLTAGAYREVERSALLPQVDLQLIARLAAPGKNQRDAVKELRASLRGR
jgi:Uma2 family endonuclease